MISGKQQPTSTTKTTTTTTTTKNHHQCPWTITVQRIQRTTSATQVAGQTPGLPRVHRAVASVTTAAAAAAAAAAARPLREPPGLRLWSPSCAFCMPGALLPHVSRPHPSICRISAGREHGGIKKAARRTRRLGWDGNASLGYTSSCCAMLVSDVLAVVRRLLYTKTFYLRTITTLGWVPTHRSSYRCTSTRTAEEVFGRCSGPRTVLNSCSPKRRTAITGDHSK